MDILGGAQGLFDLNMDQDAGGGFDDILQGLSDLFQRWLLFCVLKYHFEIIIYLFIF